MARVVLHALSEEAGLGISDSTMVVLLQPTSPLRTPEDIRSSIQHLVTSDADLAMGVTEVDAGVLKFGRLLDGRFIPISDPEHCFANRQTLPPVVRPNGAVYAFQAGWFRRNGGFVTTRIAAVSMPPERSIDVDTIQDFERVERIFIQRREGAA
jgi:N-acylneuraminate cytidylyltransferase